MTKEEYQVIALSFQICLSPINILLLRETSAILTTFSGRQCPYILKVKKLAESTHQARNIGGKKYENGDDKKSQQEYENHEIYDKMAHLIKDMILVCVYLRFKQSLNRIGRK